MVSQVARPAVRREWLTIHEASALIGVSSATLRRWSDAGDIKAFTTPGGHRRFSRAAVLGLLPAARGERPNLERLAEAAERIVRTYRRQRSSAADAIPWIHGLAESERVPFRDHGRRIADSLLGFFHEPTPEGREACLVKAEAEARTYGQIAGGQGVALSETVEVFLRFRMPFLHEIAAFARRRGLDTIEATFLLETATEAIDRLLSSLMTGHESATVLGATGGGVGAGTIDDGPGDTCQPIEAISR